MATIVPFRPREIAAEPALRAFDRGGYRHSVEIAAQAFLDLAHCMFDILDRLDGDPDFEPNADNEDDGTAEPALAALVGLASQARWSGFDSLMTGNPA